MDTTTPGMNKVLAEIDQETDVIDDLWRHALETKCGKVMEEQTNFWSAEDHRGRVKEGRDEHQ